MELLYTAHVPDGDGPHPTIVALHGWGASAAAEALHGWGASAHDLIGLAPILHRGRALVLCPQGPVVFDAGQGVAGYGWFPMSQGAPPDPTAIQLAQGLLENFIDDVCTRYPVDPAKLVLAGFSQGGFMAYRIALSDPARYAGLMAMSSWLPAELASDLEPSEAHRALPTLVVHGSQDPMLPIDRAYESRDALLKLSVPVAFREYEMGHEIRPEALRDIVGWLEQKVLSPIETA